MNFEENHPPVLFLIFSPVLFLKLSFFLYNSFLFEKMRPLVLILINGHINQNTWYSIKFRFSRESRDIQDPEASQPLEKESSVGW